MVRRISSSRPMTGSSLPPRAIWVRSRPYFSNAWYVASGFWLVTRWLPRIAVRLARMRSRVMPSRASNLAPPSPFRPASASSRCSVLT